MPLSCWVTTMVVEFSSLYENEAVVSSSVSVGVVSMWSPNSGAPVVKMLCHRGPVKAIAVDREGL